jgi:predicted metal-dependent hydrolase
MPAQITVGDLSFAVRESEQRRTVGITIDRNGSLFLHAPAGANPDAVAVWARTKRHWVFRKLAVVVHELAHIGQPRHGPAFWATVERTLPRHDLRRARLAATGTALWLG